MDQGPDTNNMKASCDKIISRHREGFEKYKRSKRDLI